jgi:hypothetical protein
MATESTRRRKDPPTPEEIREKYLDGLRNAIGDHTNKLMNLMETTGGITNEIRDVALTLTALSLSYATEEGWPIPTPDPK